MFFTLFLVYDILKMSGLSLEIKLQDIHNQILITFRTFFNHFIFKCMCSPIEKIQTLTIFYIFVFNTYIYKILHILVQNNFWCKSRNSLFFVLREIARSREIFYNFIDFSSYSFFNLVLIEYSLISLKEISLNIILSLL